LFLKEIANVLQKELFVLSGKEEGVQIKLFSPENFIPTKDGVRYFFAQNMGREIAARKNLLGPTRDDFLFFLREKPLTTTASRGEERSVLLALLATKKQFFETKTGKRPILLLDDCFSELDDYRQNALERLSDGTQSFFTTTHKEHFVRFGEFAEFKL
jgi:DNA replication and repair protein RecF